MTSDWLGLLDILACPRCHGAVARAGQEALQCRACGHEYPLQTGVPVMLLDPTRAHVAHQADLGVRPGYSRWKERIVIKSLLDGQVVLDFGAGRQALDDPCIVRLDLTLNPYVDVVGDVEHLPFADESIDFAFGGAVMEHVAHPARALDEVRRVLKRGGYLYLDWSFLQAYHGYPHHYTNVTLDGLRTMLKDFRILELGVAPFHGPAFALRSVIGTYIEHFEPRTRLEREFLDLLHRVVWHPLDDFDRRIPRAEWFRVAAATYAFAVRQDKPGDSVLPPAVLAAWRERLDLQRRFPEPLNIAVPDNLMIWAKSTGKLEDERIAASLTSVPFFTKRPVPGDRLERAEVASWPLELMDRVDPLPGDDLRQAALWRSRPLRARLAESWESAGFAGAGREALATIGRVLRGVARRVVRAATSR
jgi:uncharacterized protein YbaR (Trm112 family)